MLGYCIDQFPQCAAVANDDSPNGAGIRTAPPLFTLEQAAHTDQRPRAVRLLTGSTGFGVGGTMCSIMRLTRGSSGTSTSV